MAFGWSQQAVTEEDEARERGEERANYCGAVHYTMNPITRKMEVRRTLCKNFRVCVPCREKKIADELRAMSVFEVLYWGVIPDLTETESNTMRKRWSRYDIKYRMFPLDNNEMAIVLSGLDERLGHVLSPTSADAMRDMLEDWLQRVPYLRRVSGNMRTSKVARPASDAVSVRCLFFATDAPHREVMNAFDKVTNNRSFTTLKEAERIAEEDTLAIIADITSQGYAISTCRMAIRVTIGHLAECGICLGATSGTPEVATSTHFGWSAPASG